MSLKDYLDKVLEDNDYKSTTKALVVLEATEETLTFASIGDILDSEAAYLNLYFVSEDKNDNGILTFYVSETKE